VLPFENQGAASDDYFADGLTEEVRGKLTALPGLAVTASASSSQYRKSTKSLREIAAELGVDYLLVGKVRWDKRADGTSRVRVSPELIDARTGTSKWQEPFDAAITDVFQVQSDIAAQVAGKLDVALTDSVKTRLEARPTQNVAAYDAYLRAGSAGTDPQSLRANIAALEQAVALDPSFAQAWARLASMYASLYANSVPSREVAQSARRAMDRALALAPNDPAPYFAAVGYYSNVEAKPDSVQAAIDQVFRLDPDNPRALSSKALAEMTRGAWDSALVHIDGSIARDPRVAGRWRLKVQSLLYMHRYDEARTAADRMLQLIPGNLQFAQDRARVELLVGDLAAAREVLRRSAANPADLAAYMSVYSDLYWVLPDGDQDLVLRLPLAAFDDDPATWAAVRAQIYALRSDAARARIYADSALTAYDEQLRESPDDAQLHVLRGLALAYLGRKAEAIAEGERGVVLSASRRIQIGFYCEHQLARIYIITGEPEKAIDSIERLMKEGYWLSPGLLRIDPNFAPLRDNPRFQQLAKG
jgi:TolB-like protein/Flp pilus assembly protein TadD